MFEDISWRRRQRKESSSGGGGGNNNNSRSCCRIRNNIIALAFAFGVCVLNLFFRSDFVVVNDIPRIYDTDDDRVDEQQQQQKNTSSGTGKNSTVFAFEMEEQEPRAAKAAAAAVNNNSVGAAEAVPRTTNWTDVFSCHEIAKHDDGASSIAAAAQQGEGGEQNRKIMVNFIAAAAGKKYVNILPMYVFYALSAHRRSSSKAAEKAAQAQQQFEADAVVEIGGAAVAEIIVPDATNFVRKHKDALNFLQTEFSSPGFPDVAPAPVCVRNYSKDYRNTRTEEVNTWRFLEVPVRKSAKYTYIGDVDIFLTESPVFDPYRIRQMDEWKLPYSNIVRDYHTTKHPRRLTGLMLVETEKYYSADLLKAQSQVDTRPGGWFCDEMFLYKLVETAGFGIPPENAVSRKNDVVNLSKYRPEHGVHLSFNRGPYKPMCTVSRKAFEQLLDDDDGIRPVDEYRRHDWYVDQYLSYVQAMVEKQANENMTVIDGKCQPPPPAHNLSSGYYYYY